MGTNYSITEHFGGNLAELLTEKIRVVYPDFKGDNFIKEVEQKVEGLTYTQRIGVIAELLQKHLPADYKKALSILVAILGEENPNETGMFTHYYWIMPIGKFVELYGLAHFEESIRKLGGATFGDRRYDTVFVYHNGADSYYAAR